MIVVAFDTALAACSVALYDASRDEILAARLKPMARGHAEALPGMIEAVMAEAGMAMASLDRIAVTRGPGTFTGVRIGLATARGLALGINRPVCAMTTLEALAVGIPTPRPALVASVIDARRGEIYMQIFEVDGTAADAARLVSLETAVRQIQPGTLLVGTGTAVLIAAGCRGLPAMAPALPDAAVFVRQAAKLRPDKGALDPLYLRAPDAKPQALIVTTSDASTSIIEAGAAHASILAGLHAATFRHPWSAAEFAAMLQTPGAFALLATAGTGGGEPTGFVLARKAADEAEILTLCTRPAARRRGIARQLLTTLVGRLKAQGVVSLLLEVAADNGPAIALYRDAGFAPVGRRSGYYATGESGLCDAIIMRRHPGLT